MILLKVSDDSVIQNNSENYTLGGNSYAGGGKTPPSHRIAILMSVVGRFVVCRDCHLSVEFPAEAHYDAIVKQFDSHLCSFTTPTGDAPRVACSEGQFFVMRCQDMSIVSHEHTPDFCKQCKDIETIVLSTGEWFKVCAPSKWRSYECAAKQLVALKKPARAELPKPAEGSWRR
jgi:hypothetical protein